MPPFLPRRGFLQMASAAICLPWVAQAAPALIKKRYEWKMPLTWPKELPGLGTGAVRLAKRIGTLSEGMIQVKVFGAGELIPGPEVFDAVSEGSVELAHAGSYYWLNKHRCYNKTANIKQHVEYACIDK